MSELLTVVWVVAKAAALLGGVFLVLVCLVHTVASFTGLMVKIAVDGYREGREV